MPAVLRRINRIFRRNSRDLQNQDQDSNNPNNQGLDNQGRQPHPIRGLSNMPIGARHHSNPDALRRHHAHNRRHGHNHGNGNGTHSHSAELMYGPAPIQLRSTGYKRQSDGSVTLSVTLDKDQVECCVCLSSMTGKIYRCRGNGPSSDNTKKTVCHNICSSCQWQMRRMKSGNGHTKEMQCPICKVKGPFVRNRALERQLMELSQQCCNGKHGCSQRFFPWDDRQKLHEKHLCAYQPVDCPFCYQSIPGGRVNFVEHLTKSIQNMNIQNRSQLAANQLLQNQNGSRSQSRSPQDPIARNSNLNIQQNVNQNGFYVESPEMVDDDDDDSMQSQGAPADAAVAANSPDDGVSVISNENGPIIDIESGPEEMENLNEEMLMEDEEEEKEPIHSMASDDEMTNSNGSGSSCNNKMDVVPPCLMQWHRSKETLDLTQTERNVISKERNEFIVNYKLGIILCFVAPTSQCPCWKVYTISISPRHGLGGNSRVYIQYFDDDLMNKFVTKEQSMGLVTQCLSRPITTTMALTLGRLHPTSMRKRFGSYPERNPFLETSKSKQEEEEENLAAAKRKRMFSPRFGLNSDEMKDDGDDLEEEEEEQEVERGLPHSVDLALSNHNGNGPRSRLASDSKMDQDTVEMNASGDDDDGTKMSGDDVDHNNCNDDECSDLEEFEPTEFFGHSPCSQIQCGFIFGGDPQFGSGAMSLLCIRTFTLEESFKVGAVIDARDFTGKWYQAEVIAVEDEEGVEHGNLDCDADDYLDIRRAKIHYLGYSQNYDEWLNVDTDSHRIAQRGTFTIGPDLRAIRRNTSNLQHGHHPDQPRSHSVAATFSMSRSGSNVRSRNNNGSNRYSNVLQQMANGGNDNLDQ